MCDYAYLRPVQPPLDPTELYEEAERRKREKKGCGISFTALSEITSKKTPDKEKKRVEMEFLEDVVR